MGTTLICRLARRLALMAALAAATFVFVTSTTGAGVLLDSHTVTAPATAHGE
jgi:hypothetical protein